jgi:hypothetical protein
VRFRPKVLPADILTNTDATIEGRSREGLSADKCSVNLKMGENNLKIEWTN